VDSREPDEVEPFSWATRAAARAGRRSENEEGDVGGLSVAVEVECDAAGFFVGVFVLGILLGGSVWPVFFIFDMSVQH